MLMDAYLGGQVYFYLKRNGPLREECVRFITGCVVEALGYLRLRGIAYRDLKPENIMLDER